MKELMNDLEPQGAMFDMGEIYRRLFGGRASCSQGCCHSMAETWILGSSKEQVPSGSATNHDKIVSIDSVLDQSLIESKDSLISLDDKNNNKPTNVSAGLYNTCYIASVLQCLIRTVPLIESLSSYNQQSPCNCKTIASGGKDTFCVLRALCDQLALTGHKFGIDAFAQNIEHFSSDFQIDNQEDAYEFLQSFLDKLDQCCKDETVSSLDSNVVDHIFGGVILHRLRCCCCNFYSNTYEPSFGWSLEIEDIESLNNALESYTNFEKLEDLTRDNCCNDSDEKVSKVKQFKLHKLPLVAIFHLKTFKNNMEKIIKHVEFSLDLDLLPYTTYNQNPEVSTKYELYAMVEHIGHYISYVRSGDTWLLFDDEKVTNVTKEEVLTKNPYILFYVREGCLGRGPAIGIDLSTTKSCVGEIIPNDQGNRTTDDAAMIPVNSDTKKQEDDEAKQLLVDMIVNETMRNTGFMDHLRETKVDAGKIAWDEKRKKEKEELKKKREELKKKREEKQKAIGKKKKK